MKSPVAKMLCESIQRGDPLDAEWFWEAGSLSAREGTPLDMVIWEAVRQIIEDCRLAAPTAEREAERSPAV